MYQKTAAEHFAEAMNRLSKHPHPFAHADDQPQTEQPQARRELHSPSRSVARPALAASPWHARWAGV